MPDVTSLATDLDDHSRWFFDAKPDDAPRWHEIAERLRDLSNYGGSLPADDPQVQRWDRVERLIEPPAQRAPVSYFDHVREWAAVLDASTNDEALRTFITLHAEDWISFLLRLGADRGAVLMKAMAVDITPGRFEEIATRASGGPS
jgi:hypothetical protein